MCTRGFYGMQVDRPCSDGDEAVGGRVRGRGGAALRETDKIEFSDGTVIFCELLFEVRGHDPMADTQTPARHGPFLFLGD